MQITAYKKLRLPNGDILHRIAIDGLAGTEGAENQFITQLAAFTVQEVGKVVYLDNFFCGIDYQRASQTAMISIGLNVYKSGIDASQLNDDQTPDFKQSIPVGFNDNSGSEYAKWTQEPYAFAGKGELLQVCVNLSPNTGDSASPTPFTVQFRERHMDGNFG